MLTVATGVNFTVEYLSVCQMSLSLLSGQDGLNVVIVQTQSLEEDKEDTDINGWSMLYVVFRVRFWICNLYFDVRQVDEARERSEVVVV